MVGTPVYFPVAQAGVPLFLWGPSGVGKTEAVHAWARRNGLHLEMFTGTLDSSADVLGYVATRPDGRLDHIVPEWVHRLTAKGGVLFVDELNRGEQQTRNALLKPISQRAVQGVVFPDTVAIIAAGNKTGDVAELDDATMKRFCHLQFSAGTAEEWGEALVSDSWPAAGVLPEGWAGHLPYQRQLVALFTAARPELLDPPEDDRQDQGRPCRRTWALLARARAACASLELPPAPVDAGLVGSAAATEFAHFVKKLDLPRPRDVLAGKWSPGSRDQQRAALLSILPLVTTPETWLAAWEQVARVREDIGLLVARQLAARRPEKARTPKLSSAFLAVLGVR